MRYKVVPPARDVTFLRDVVAALPLVPGTVEDCCTRIRDRTDVPSRDEAREWLTFCQALDLAVETESGFHRVHDPPDDETLVTNFEVHVFGADEVLRALDGAGGPLDAGSVFEATIEPTVPTWERSRSDDWEATWRERTERLLDWGVAFGLVERVDGGFQLVASPDED